MNANYNNYSASAIDSAGFDIINEWLIPTQIFNPVISDAFNSIDLQ